MGTAATELIRSLGSTGAFLIAALAYRQAVRDRQKEQAYKVAVWIDPDCLIVKNSSDDPVHHVEVELWDVHVGGQVGSTIRLPVLGGQTTRRIPFSDEALEYRKPIPGFPLETADDLLEFSVKPELKLFDRAGRHWQRDVVGRVTRYRYGTRRERIAWSWRRLRRKLLRKPLSVVPIRVNEESARD